MSPKLQKTNWREYYLIYNEINDSLKYSLPDTGFLAAVGRIAANL